MLEQELLKRVISRTQDIVVFKLDHGVIIRAFADGTVTRSDNLAEKIIWEWHNPAIKREVSFWLNGKRYCIRKRRLIALAFLGLPENEDTIVRRIDSNIDSDAFTNIEWSTKKEDAQVRNLMNRIIRYGIKLERCLSVKEYKELESLGFNIQTNESIPEDRCNMKKIAEYINRAELKIRVHEEDVSDVLSWNILET